MERRISTLIKCFAVNNSFQLTPQGDIQPCCKFREPFSKLSSYATVEDIFNDSELDDLRANHAQGEWTSNCRRCKEDEELGSQSRRKMYDRLGLVAGKDFFLDISLGNFCNLKCRMCGPGNSTQWKKDHLALVDVGLTTDEDTTAHIVTARQIDMICKFLTTKSGRVIIEVKGGEILITPTSKYFFEQLSQCPNAKNFELWLTTNGTRIPIWYKDTMSKFNLVQCFVSIDGTGATYNYIRGNKYSFEDIMTNTRRLQNMTNHDIKFNVVVQNLNIENLPDLGASLNEISSEIMLIVLRSPKYYQVNVFPEERKEAVISDLENSILKDHEVLPHIISLMRQPCPPNMWSKFLKISTKLDELRGQNLFSVMEGTDKY